jgi:hypothetical protein
MTRASGSKDLRADRLRGPPTPVSPTAQRAALQRRQRQGGRSEIDPAGQVARAQDGRIDLCQVEPNAVTGRERPVVAEQGQRERSGGRVVGGHVDPCTCRLSSAARYRRRATRPRRARVERRGARARERVAHRHVTEPDVDRVRASPEDALPSGRNMLTRTLRGADRRRDDGRLPRRRTGVSARIVQRPACVGPYVGLAEAGCERLKSKNLGCLP